MTVRNMLYQTGMFKSERYDFPVIGVGNLRVGGTGKTPMIEFLTRQLRSDRRLATLSRGYGRKTNGFLIADEETGPTELGDEPSQIKKKFGDVVVAVDGDRRNGIRKLRNEHPEINAILLDDVFQHRGVNPGMMILLTAYDQLYLNDAVLPAGRLREPKSGAGRADIIVVTKCPNRLDAFERRSVRDRINPKSHQQVLFATESYGRPYSLRDSAVEISSNVTSVVLITGIANASRMVNYLEDVYDVKEHLEYQDHHWFKEKDVEQLLKVYTELNDEKVAILTTEKDAQRLETLLQNETFGNLPVYALPMKMEFLGDDGQKFNQALDDFIRSYS